MVVERRFASESVKWRSWLLRCLRLNMPSDCGIKIIIWWCPRWWLPTRLDDGLRFRRPNHSWLGVKPRLLLTNLRLLLLKPLLQRIGLLCHRELLGNRIDHSSPVLNQILISGLGKMPLNEIQHSSIFFNCNSIVSQDLIFASRF